MLHYCDIHSLNPPKDISPMFQKHHSLTFLYYQSILLYTLCNKFCKEQNVEARLKYAKQLSRYIVLGDIKIIKFDIY